MEGMIIKDDMLVNQDPTTYDTSNQSKDFEEALIDNFPPCFKRLESFGSVKSSDLYFKNMSSIFHENSNKVEEKEFILNDPHYLTDNYNNAFNLLKNLDDSFGDSLEGEEENNLLIENRFNSPLFPSYEIYQNTLFSIENLTISDYVICFNAPEKATTKGKEIETIEITEENIKKGGETVKPKEKKLKRGKRGPYKKKKKQIIKTKTNGKCFPFSTANSLLTEDNVTSRIKCLNAIFRTNIYITDSDGNVKKQKKKRKYKADDIRKKIKVRFHKKLKNIINENLKKAGSTELFSFLPQYFLGNISKKFNNQYMNKTFEQLLSEDFSSLQKEYFNKECDKNQFDKNKKTLEYLEKNQEISRISGFDEVKKMKYKDLLKAYFASTEFENSIEKLKEEKESDEYIQEYFFLARDYIEYFTVLDGL